ncbi:unnamed protein product [Caenorhabditis nigoni]
MWGKAKVPIAYGGMHKDDLDRCRRLDFYEEEMYQEVHHSVTTQDPLTTVYCIRVWVETNESLKANCLEIANKDFEDFETPKKSEINGDTIRKHIPRGRIRDLASAFDKMNDGPVRLLEFKSQVHIPTTIATPTAREKTLWNSRKPSGASRESDVNRADSRMSGPLSGPLNGSSSSAFRSSTQTIRLQEDRRRSTSSSLHHQPLSTRLLQLKSIEKARFRRRCSTRIWRNPPPKTPRSQNISEKSTSQFALKCRSTSLEDNCYPTTQEPKLRRYHLLNSNLDTSRLPLVAI